MPPKNKKKVRSPPKHLEKMLFINHKEDQLLQDRLDRLHLRSRLREIELDRERIGVRNELRESKKKQIPFDPNDPLSKPNTKTRPQSTVNNKPKTITFVRSSSAKSRADDNSPQDDNVNAYLLGEYRRMSEVIPSILLNLSAKDEAAKEKMKNASRAQLSAQSQGYNADWEPDLDKITKTVTSVKTLRHNMAINKKLENSRPSISLSKVFKELYTKEDHLDQYTDGACVLLKRKIEKRRRGSTGEVPATMKRGNSAHGCISEEIITLSASSQNTPKHRTSSLPSVSRALTPRSLSRSGSVISLNGRRTDDNKHTGFIDQDELMLRRRIACELHRYDKIKEKVDSFLMYPKQIREEIIPLIVK